MSESEEHQGPVVKRVQRVQQRKTEESKKPRATTQHTRSDQNPIVAWETDHSWSSSDNPTVSRRPLGIEIDSLAENRSTTSYSNFCATTSDIASNPPLSDTYDRKTRDSMGLGRREVSSLPARRRSARTRNLSNRKKQDREAYEDTLQTISDCKEPEGPTYALNIDGLGLSPAQNDRAGKVADSHYHRTPQHGGYPSRSQAEGQRSSGVIFSMERGSRQDLGRIAAPSVASSQCSLRTYNGTEEYDGQITDSDSSSSGQTSIVSSVKDPYYPPDQDMLLSDVKQAPKYMKGNKMDIRHRLNGDMKPP